MSLLRKIALTWVVQFGLCTACVVGQAQTIEPTAISAANKADLNKAITLLDSWQGNPSTLSEVKILLDRVLRSNPNLAAAHREYARYHLSSGYIRGLSGTPESLAAAERSLNEALRINPKYAEAYVLAGHLYYLQNRYEDALNALNKAKAIGTADPWLPLNTANVLISQGRHNEAAKNYQDVIASGTKNKNAMMAAFSGLIDFYEATHQTQKAEEIHLQKIAYEPQTAWSYGNYAHFLLCTKDDAEKAIIQFRKALGLMDYGVARIGLAAAIHRKLASKSSRTLSGNEIALLNEAQSLRPGTPIEVVSDFCPGSPAALAVQKAQTSKTLLVAPEGSPRSTQ